MSQYEVIVVAVAFANMILNISMMLTIAWVYWKIHRSHLNSDEVQKQFAEVYWRMDKAAIVHAQALDERIIERTNDLNNRLNYIARWQKISAKMIRELQTQERKEG